MTTLLAVLFLNILTVGEWRSYALIVTNHLLSKTTVLNAVRINSKPDSGRSIRFSLSANTIKRQGVVGKVYDHSQPENLVTGTDKN